MDQRTSTAFFSGFSLFWIQSWRKELQENFDTKQGVYNFKEWKKLVKPLKNLVSIVVNGTACQKCC